MGITDTARWKAVYNDGTSLSELDPDGGKQHIFTEIDFDKIESFQLVNPQGIAVCEVRLNKDKRLIFTRRNLITTGQLFKQEGNSKIPIPTKHRSRIIILGWQKTINGVNTKAIFYLLPDGRIEMDDEWKEDSLHYKVNTPGLIQEEEPKPKQTFNSLGGKPVSENETKYSGSNDSAFRNKK